MGNDLSRDWRNCRALTAEEYTNLHRLGITPATSVLAPGGGVLVAFVETAGEFFQPAPPGAGRKMLLTVTDLVEGEDHLEIADLLAFDPRQPDQWWLRLGVVNWLGAWELDRRTMTGLGGPGYAPPFCQAGGRAFDALKLHRHPLGWLRGGCVGSVPLTPEGIDDLRLCDTPVLCEDLTHAEEIERQLQVPRLPMPVLTLPLSAEAAA